MDLLDTFVHILILEVSVKTCTYVSERSTCVSLHNLLHYLNTVYSENRYSTCDLKIKEKEQTILYKVSNDILLDTYLEFHSTKTRKNIFPSGALNLREET